jgi:hypothetical protein
MPNYRSGSENLPIRERRTGKMPNERLMASSTHPPKVHKTLYEKEKQELLDELSSFQGNDV